MTELRDRRVNYLDLLARTNDVLGQSLFGPIRDSLRCALPQLTDFASSLSQGPPLQLGLVVHAMPYVNWYKVQLGIGGTLPCCFAQGGSFLPLGVRPTAPLPPNSIVIVWKYLPHEGVILGALPTRMSSGAVGMPDWLSQGGGSGMHRERCHYEVLKLLAREGGVRDYSSGRPLDATALDWGWLAETGVGLNINAFETWMRVNEACGLFLSYYGQGSTRLAGVQMDQVSAVHELMCRYDEGEVNCFLGYATYPWEALGMTQPGQEWTTSNDDVEVLHRLNRGKRDLPSGMEDQLPIYRVQHYPGGYLGQGGQRFLWAPDQLSGPNRYGGEEVGHGLFEEVLTLHGDWGVRAARSVTIAKDILIPVPKPKRLPEDQQSGDSLAAGNYRFSGQTDQGSQHVFQDLKPTGDNQNLTTVAGIQDHFSYLFNWLGRATYKYHAGDFTTPEESDQETITVAQDNISFGDLSSAAQLPFPSPQTLTIDHRYGEVDYYARRTMIAFTPDGGAIVQDGYGTRICTTGGNAQIDAPGDVSLIAGKRILLRAGSDISVQAHKSLDLVASHGDIHAKAEVNLQLLGANSGSGSVLIESKGSGKTHNYHDKFGEDVRGSGIILKAKDSQIINWGAEIYLRTGSGTSPSGKIVLDAAKGMDDVVLVGNRIHGYVQDEFGLWIGPHEENSHPTELVRLNETMSIISTSLLLRGDLTTRNGSLFIDGDCELNQGTYLSTSGQDNIPPLDRNSQGQLVKYLQDKEQEIVKELKRGETEHGQQLVQGFYQRGQAGNTSLIEEAGFSFRDDKSGTQYGADHFQLLEPLWQQMVHQGGGSGGTPWKETSVSYQGRQLQPFPGKEAWTGQSLLSVTSPSLYDAAAGRSRSRAELERPAYGEMQATAADGRFLVLG